MSQWFWAPEVLGSSVMLVYSLQPVGTFHLIRLIRYYLFPVISEWSACKLALGSQMHFNYKIHFLSRASPSLIREYKEQNSKEKGRRKKKHAQKSLMTERWI